MVDVLQITHLQSRLNKYEMLLVEHPSLKIFRRAYTSYILSHMQSALKILDQRTYPSYHRNMRRACTYVRSRGIIFSRWPENSYPSYLSLKYTSSVHVSVILVTCYVCRVAIGYQCHDRGIAINLIFKFQGHYCWLNLLLFGHWISLSSYSYST